MVTSCISPLTRPDAPTTFEDPWPVLIQGVRIYGGARPPDPASELLRFARLLKAAALLDTPER